MKFVLMSDLHVSTVTRATGKTMDGEVIDTEVIGGKMSIRTVKLPDEYVIISPMPEYGDVFTADEYDEYLDYGRWAVEIDGKIYESNQHWVTEDKPEWATHFSYYSK